MQLQSFSVVLMSIKQDNASSGGQLSNSKSADVQPQPSSMAQLSSNNMSLVEVNLLTVKTQSRISNHLQQRRLVQQSIISQHRYSVTPASTIEAMSAEHSEFNKHCLGQSVQDTGGVYVNNEGQVKSQYGLIFKRHLCQPSMGIGHNDK